MAIRSFQFSNQRIATDIRNGMLSPRYVLNLVTTGGGKSSIPPIYAVTLIPDVADKVCWVVPRSSLRRQGERSFHSQFLREWLGAMRNARASVNEQNPSRDTHGYVTTYQAIAQNPDVHRMEFETGRYILVLDEVHHVEEHGAWHAPLIPLVERAQLVILMTGTLERGDGRRIAFVDYKSVPGGERPVTDYTTECPVVKYTRSDALAQEAILPIEFKHYDFGGTWVGVDGEKQSVESFDQVEYDETGAAIWAGIQSNYALDMLSDCARDWIAYRRDHPSSRLLIVASRQSIAKEYAKHLKDRHGIASAVAVSDDGDFAQESIERFSKGRVDALVTVGMAYEGLDVPGITHLACLTGIRSKPWIEQMLGRLVRVDPEPSAGPWKAQRAFAYVPDDKWMCEVINEIEAEQAPFVKVREAQREADADAVGVGDQAPRDLGGVIALDGLVSGIRSSELDGVGLSREETARIEWAIDAGGLKGRISVGEFARLERLHQQASQFETLHRAVPFTVTTSEEEERLRSAIEDVARRIDKALQRPWGTTNSEIKARFGNKSRDFMANAELRAVWSHLNTRYADVLR